MFSEFIYKKQVQLFIAILNRIECGSLQLTLPDGSIHDFKSGKPGPDADLRLRTRSALSRILRDGKMGFCEAIMDGDASSNTLPSLIELNLNATLLGRSIIIPKLTEKETILVGQLCQSFPS